MKTYDRNRNAITTGSRVMVATNGAPELGDIVLRTLLLSDS